jgi:twitching motility protein PilT
VSVYPPHQQLQARIQLAGVLKGVVSQRLIPKADGVGMIPAVEVFVSTARVRELVADPKRTREIHDAIATGRDPYGMISFDQSLLDLVRRKLVTYDAALSQATNPDDFALRYRGIGRGGDSVEPADAPPPEAELQMDDEPGPEPPGRLRR